MFDQTASGTQLHVYSAFQDCFNNLEIAQAPDLHGTYKSNNSPSHAILLASFPGCSQLQSLNVCSMQTRRGKAWEIWSRVVTSGRQRVDTWGWCQMKNLEALSCNVSLRMEAVRT